MGLTLLRNGQVTRDRRLDRIREVDLRSLNYSVADVLPKNQGFRSFTWGIDTVLDQGESSSCTGHGFSHELMAKPLVEPNIDHTFAVEKIYWEAQKIDEFPGGEYPGAHPVEGGSSVLAAAKVCQHMGYYKEYRWALNIDDLIMAIGHHGPAVIGVDWYEQMMDVDSQGYIRPQGKIVGGHCVCIIGVKVHVGIDGSVDPVRSHFVIVNSWGRGWGLNGRCLLSMVDLAVLWNGGEFCVPVVRSKVTA